MAQYSPEGLAKHSPSEFMPDAFTAAFDSQLNHTNCMCTLPKCALTPRVPRQDCLSRMKRFLTVFSSLEKQFCHVAKSNVLADSIYQAEQVASASMHAAAVHTVCIGASA